MLSFLYANTLYMELRKSGAWRIVPMKLTKSSTDARHQRQATRIAYIFQLHYRLSNLLEQKLTSLRQLIRIVPRREILQPALLLLPWWWMDRRIVVVVVVWPNAFGAQTQRVDICVNDERETDDDEKASKDCSCDFKLLACTTDADSYILSAAHCAEHIRWQAHMFLECILGSSRSRDGFMRHQVLEFAAYKTSCWRDTVFVWHIVDVFISRVQHPEQPEITNTHTHTFKMRARSTVTPVKFKWPQCQCRVHWVQRQCCNVRPESACDAINHTRTETHHHLSPRPANILMSRLIHQHTTPLWRQRERTFTAERSRDEIFHTLWVARINEEDGEEVEEEDKAYKSVWINRHATAFE